MAEPRTGGDGCWWRSGQGRQPWGEVNRQRARARVRHPDSGIMTIWEVGMADEHRLARQGRA
jgi:hypothetical protein